MLDANQEIRAQGLSNVVGALFSGYLSSGSFTRSGLSFEPVPGRHLAGVFFSAVGGFVCRHRGKTDCSYPDSGRGGRYFVDQLGAGGHARHTCFVAGKPGRVRGHGADGCGHLVAGAASGDLCRCWPRCFYLKRTSRPRIQRWREGDEEVLRVGGSIFFGASHYLQVRLQRTQGVPGGD